MVKTVDKRRIEKIVISGNVIEYYRYFVPISVEPREHEIIKGSKKEQGKRKDNLSRARQSIRRAIWCNQTEYTKFVTLTYKDTVLDLDVVIKDFKRFIKNLRRKGYNVPYLYVTEHQKKRGKREGNAGCLHIHTLLFTDTYIPADDINKAWNKGNTDIHRVKSIKNLGAYVCKYLTKDELDEYFKNSYHISRGLKKSEVWATDGYIGDWGELYKGLLDHTKITYADVINVDYKLKNGEKQQNAILYQQGVLHK